MSWFPGTTTSGRSSDRRSRGRPLLLLGLVAVGEIAGDEDDLGVGPLHELDQIGLHLRLLVRSRMEVGNVQQPEVRHRAGRL